MRAESILVLDGDKFRLPIEIDRSPSSRHLKSARRLIRNQSIIKKD